jgi:hypothetical protein
MVWLSFLPSGALPMVTYEARITSKKFGSFCTVTSTPMPAASPPCLARTSGDKPRLPTDRAHNRAPASRSVLISSRFNDVSFLSPVWMQKRTG